MKQGGLLASGLSARDSVLVFHGEIGYMVLPGFLEVSAIADYATSKNVEISTLSVGPSLTIYPLHPARYHPVGLAVTGYYQRSFFYGDVVDLLRQNDRVFKGYGLGLAATLFAHLPFYKKIRLIPSISAQYGSATIEIPLLPGPPSPPERRTLSGTSTIHAQASEEPSVRVSGSALSIEIGLGIHRNTALLGIGAMLCASVNDERDVEGGITLLLTYNN